MRTLFVNIKELVQVRETPVRKVAGEQMKVLPTLKNAFLLIENDRIKDFGLMSNLTDFDVDETIDVTGKIILPTWCDSHTHLVFGDDRHEEFVDKINGLSYEEIANNGGGILNSAKKIQTISEEDLYEKSIIRLKNAVNQGTGAIEIKSGYGLTVESELKILRVIKKLEETVDIPIKATFLGAHAIPTEYKSNPDGYVDLIIDEMLPKIADENLADYIDVFCEKGYFTPTQMDRILKAGISHGLTPKVHINQFYSIGGVEVALNNNALTVDHLEILTDNEINLLLESNTIPVALPLCSLFIEIPYTPARRIIDKGLPIAIASDFNPGSAPSSNLNLALSLACIKMKMTPEEAINALTINAAFAMDQENDMGSITKGKFGSFILTNQIESYKMMPYYFGQNHIDSVYIKGKKVNA